MNFSLPNFEFNNFILSLAIYDYGDTNVVDDDYDCDQYDSYGNEDHD